MNYKINLSPLFLAICLLSVAQFGFFLYTPALPAIATYFNTSSAYIQITLSSFILGYGVLQFISGLMADIFSLKKLIIFFISIYLLANLVCFFSINYIMFLSVRVVEGASAGAISSLARVLIIRSYEDKHLLKNMAIYSMASVFVPAISPYIGGEIIAFSKWQYIFLFLSFYTAILLVLFLFYNPSKDNCVVAGLKRENFLWKAIRWNIFSVLHCGKFIKYSISNIFIYFLYMLEITFAPFILIKQYGLTEERYGKLMVLPALGYFLGSYILNKISVVMKKDFIINMGLFIIFCSGVILWILFSLHELASLNIIICLALNTFGAAFILSPLAVKAYSIKQKVNANGTIIAIFGSMQMLGTSLLISIASVVTSSYINAFIYSYILVPFLVFLILINEG